MSRNNIESERAENRVSIIPRELRVPVFTARLFLATLAASAGAIVAVEAAKTFTGNNSIVQAADPECKIGKFVVFGFGFIDNPEKPNRAGLIDPIDFSIGATEFGQARLAVLTDPKNPNSKRQEFSGSMVVLGDHAEVRFANLSVTPNTKGINGKDAAEVLVSFKEDKVRQTDNPLLPPEKAVVVECGQDGVAWGGRYAPVEDIHKVVKNAKAISTVGAEIDRLMEGTFGKGRKFGLTPQGDDPQQNLKILRNSIAEAIQHADAVRKKERELAKPSPTAPAINVVTSTVTITDTRPISPTTGITQTKPITSTSVTTKTEVMTPTKGIGTPGSNLGETPATDGSTFILSGLWEGLKFAGDLPAKAMDQITEPDTEFPLRAGIDILAWLVLLRALKRVPKIGVVSIPGAYILGTSLFPLRYSIARWQYRRATAAAVAAGIAVPAWNRPPLAI